jgi:hypothetical protein
MLEHLHAATFSAQLHTVFRFHLPSMPVVEVELVEVAEPSPPGERQARAAARQERFSLLFRGPPESVLPQWNYSIQHDQLGTFDLFLVPVGREKEGVLYEAVFNRLRQDDE